VRQTLGGTDGWHDLPYAIWMNGLAEERAALVAMLRSLPKGESWFKVTEAVLKHGSALAVWAEQADDALIPDPAREYLLTEALRQVQEWESSGLDLLTILDERYPLRVREIHQAPPFLFASGTVLPEDPAVAVVGSRKASPAGLEMAASIARLLADDGITVLSGLALGIDTAAHTVALAAGNRTVAIIGTGIERYYPAGNRLLQDEVASKGLVLSQFWPDGPPQRSNFLMRNAVMSGYGRATVVVEAGEKSGARAQARLAVEHGRPVILTDRVVASNEWAQRLVDRPDVHTAAGPTEVMSHVCRLLDRGSRIDRLLGDFLSPDQ
jgi:DNA processing protein